MTIGRGGPGGAASGTVVHRDDRPGRLLWIFIRPTTEWDSIKQVASMQSLARQPDESLRLDLELRSISRTRLHARDGDHPGRPVLLAGLDQAAASAGSVAVPVRGHATAAEDAGRACWRPLNLVVMFQVLPLGLPTLKNDIPHACGLVLFAAAPGEVEDSARDLRPRGGGLARRGDHADDGQVQRSGGDGGRPGTARGGVGRAGSDRRPRAGDPLGRIGRAGGVSGLGTLLHAQLLEVRKSSVPDPLEDRVDGPPGQD